jgi:hypothetical protein
MFGLGIKNDHPELRAAQNLERSIALKRWPSLTAEDLMMIKNRTQLVTAVSDRMGLSCEDAATDVSDWIVGYATRQWTPPPIA